VSTLILWDGDCGFCRRAVQWALDHDRSGGLEATPWQAAPSPPMNDALAEACLTAVHVITDDGRTLRAGRASLHVLRLCGYRLTSATLSLPPLVWCVEAGYWLVARNRMLFSRVLFRAFPWVLVFFGVLAGCRPASVAPQPPAGASERAAVVEEELVALFDDAFDVVGVEAGSEDVVCWAVHLQPPAPQLIRTRFQADLRATRVVEQPRRTAILADVGQPGWSVDSGEDAWDRAALLRDGTYSPGDAVQVAGAALFTDLQPGWRFRIFDRSDAADLGPCL
jgi:predicted DCC family thiol-disulfide oxidoreductase YuxK